MGLARWLSGLHPRVVPPGVLAFAFGALLVVARFYDRLPVRPPPCGLRTLTGFPCIGCGGTRAMMALSHGHWLEALRFNPLIILLATAVPFWLAWAIWKTRREASGLIVDSAPAQADPVKARSPWRAVWITLLIAGAVVLDWVYLWLYLPP